MKTLESLYIYTESIKIKFVLKIHKIYVACDENRKKTNMYKKCNDVASTLVLDPSLQRSLSRQQFLTTQPLDPCSSVEQFWKSFLGRQFHAQPLTVES